MFVLRENEICNYYTEYTVRTVILDGNNVRSPGTNGRELRVCNFLTRYGLDPIFRKSLSIRNLTFFIQATLA